MRSSLSLSCIRLFTFVWRLYVRFETFLSSFSLSLSLSFFLSFFLHSAGFVIFLRVGEKLLFLFV